MQCRYCGMMVPDGTKICPGCGSVIATNTNSFGQNVNRAVNNVNQSLSGAAASPVTARPAGRGLRRTEAF